MKHIPSFKGLLNRKGKPEKQDNENSSEFSSVVENSKNDSRENSSTDLAPEQPKNVKNNERRKQLDEEKERRAREREKQREEASKEPEIPRLNGEKRFANYFFVSGWLQGDSLELFQSNQEGEFVAQIDV